MANKRATVYLSGKVYWAKIFGDPRPNYGGDAREWAFEFEPDDASVQELAENGLKDRIKNKYDDRGGYIILKRNEFKADGEPNEHIRVVDADNQPWDNRMLGNGTEVDVKVNIVDYGPGKKKGIYPVAIRVLDLVVFERDDFAPLPKDDERRVKAASRKTDQLEQFNKDFGIEEEPPFDADEPKPPKGKRRIPDAELDDDVEL